MCDIQTIQFADGSSISSQDFVMRRGLTLTGTDGADYLIGGDARNGWIPDRLEGGKGCGDLFGRCKVEVANDSRYEAERKVT